MVESGNLFSADWQEEDPGKWGSDIAAAFTELKTLVKGEMRCVKWNDSYIAAAFTVRVSLPSRGPVNKIDIRAQEPVMLVFSKQDYPERAPMVRSDRKDFPVSRLPHLNPVRPGQPPFLCLHRGNINDWFAEHTLGDLLKLAQDWLADAASNRLIPPGDYFEPTRLVDSNGTIIFAPSQLEHFVIHEWKRNGGKAGFAFLVMEFLGNTDRFNILDGVLPFKIGFPTGRNADWAKILKPIKALNELANKNSRVNLHLFGVLCWTDRENPIREYFGHLPGSMGEIVKFARSCNAPLEEAIQEYASLGLKVLNAIPIVFAVNRPQKLIKSDSSLEPLCFVADGQKFDPSVTSELPDDAKVFCLSHRAPLTPEFAKDIAGIADSKSLRPLLHFGCGALGSKIALHFGRAGLIPLTLVDQAIFSPHNLIRNGLPPQFIGWNKAEAIKELIEGMYEGLPDKQRLVSYAGSALDWIKGSRKSELREHEMLIDTSASGSVLEALVRNPIPRDLKVVRGEIADQGRVGILSVEGTNRSPRLDDLQVLVRDVALENEQLEGWLRRERSQREERVGPALNEIAIGIGCSSDTMRLADDIASLHAAAFSTSIRKLLVHHRRAEAGQIILNLLNEDGKGASPDFGMITISVPPVIELSPYRDWNVRIHRQAADQMQELLRAASPNEIGGAMIGLIHSKRQIIYVTRVLDPTPDSIGTKYEFRRGIQELPKAVVEIQRKTGGLLGYVGDWHTHPRGSGALSPTDIKAMLETKREFDMAGLPTFALIVTPKKFHAHIRV